MTRRSAYAYVSETTRKNFTSYRVDCGLLTDANLLALLVSRELTIRTLESTKEMVPLTYGPGPLREKITLNFNEAGAERFRIYSEIIKLDASTWTRIVAERELSEKWLLSALSWSPAR